MFFNLGHKKDAHQRWPHTVRLTSTFILEMDEGWTELETKEFKIMYKGYLDFKDLGQELEKLSSTSPIKETGNFLAFIVHHNEKVSVLQPEERTTPLFYQDEPDFFHMTNLSKKPEHFTLMRNEWLEITPEGRASIQSFHPCESPPLYEKSEDEVLQELNNYLNKKIRHFFKLQAGANFKLFHSRGADTSTLYAYILKNNFDVEIIQGEHKGPGVFYDNFKKYLNSTWNYQQIHHWSRPCILISGAHGDEMLLRTPLSATLLLSLVGARPLSLIKKRPKGYNSQYLMRKNNRPELKRAQRRGLVKRIFKSFDRNELYDELKFYMLDDYQHWHLGHTLTYTPFKDIHLLRILLQGPVHLWQKQFTDAYVNKKLIEMNSSELLNQMSSSKNQN